MKKRFTSLMTLVIALCTSSAWAQSVISVGTNLDFSEGTPVDNGICTYGKDMAGNNTTYYGELAVDGWTAQPKGTTDEKGYENSSLAGGLFAYGSGHWLGGAGYNVPATNPEGVAEGNALGIIGVWSGTVQYVQAVTLEPGDYVISALVYNAVGGTTAFVKNLIGFIADNGTEYLASTKTYAVDTWTVENIKFTLTETTAGKLSLGYAAAGTGSGGNQHLFIDKVEVLAVTEADLARIDLNAALVSAQATVDAKVGVGAGVFMYSEEAYNAYAAAVAAAKAVSENAEATKDELVEALAALNAATAAYTVTVPAADAIYAVKFNGSDNYLTIGESTITIDAAVDTLSFEAVGNGKYYVHDNAGKYIYYSGTGNNIWSMSAAADKKDEWTISVNAEGLYAFVGKNGGIGVDGTEAGASCYGDKKGAAMALWTITEIVIEDEPGNEGGDDVVVAEGNLIENPGFEKWEGGNPVNWAGVGHNATIKQSADAKSGSYAVEVAGANANKRLASQAYTLKPGTYKYSVNVKQTGDAAGMYRLGYIKLTDGAIANTSTDYIYITEPASVSAEWSEVSCEFTLEAATEIALVVMNSKNGKGASILVDDVALTTNNGGNEGGDDEGEEEQKPISGTIAEVVAAGVQASASTSGTVVATYARGFLIGDGTGYVLTYLGKDSGLAVGDVVTVAGATSMYGGLLQFGNASTFEKTGTATFTQPDPEVLDGAAMDAYLAAPVIKYVQYTGTLAISGNYYNVTVDGAQKAVGSIQYAPEGLVDAALNGKKIVVTGYSIGVSSSKYVNTMGVSVVAAEEEPAVKTDYTDAIVNADLSTADAWNTEGTKGISGGMVKVASESPFDFSQTITLPAGQYKMTAKAAYRYTGGEQEEYDAIQAGTETHLVKLYAETSSYKYEGDVKNRWEGASDTDYANGDGSKNINGKFVPNSSNAVLAWFNAGQYVNELVFNVQEESAIKIGITRVGSIAGDYTNIGAWTLTRLGDAEADPEIEEPIEPEPEETIDMDLTHLVGTSKEAWNATGGPVNIDGISMPENFQDDSSITGVVLWQDVTGLENGKYTVELWANARVAWRESAATDGQEELTYLVANNVEISMQVLLNPGLNNNATYVLEGVEVTDGTLHIEMNKKAAGSNWHTIQIKSLIYHAPANAALDMAKADLKAALDAAAAVPATEALTAAIAAAQAIYDGSDLEAIKAAVAPLKAATALAVNTNAVAGATVAAPVVTNFVVNGTFDTNGVTAPWKTTTKAQNQTTATNQTGAFTGNFFENWNPSNYTGKIYQVIENIPNGLYELSICAFVQTFDATAQFVYANADKKALVAGAPTAYTVRTTVIDNTIEIGFEQTAAVNQWSGIDNVSLKYFGEVDENYAKDMYASTKAAAEALLNEKMSAEAKAALEAALAVEVDETSDEALIAAEAALQEVMATVKASVNFYASNKKAIDAMFALMESTNVYTAEAFAAYSAKAEDFLAQYEADTLTATVDNPAAIHGWHASVDYDDLLLSAFGVKDFDTNLYINTWSNEGETDGSEFKVPFFEYWTGDDQSLGATTKTATVTGLEPGELYSLEAWVRTRAKNGVAAAEATGITLNVGAGAAVDVTEGAVIGTSQFAHAVYKATGVADENGNLTINFNVAAENNVSWLSFKDLKYSVAPASDEFLYVYAQLEGLTETCYTMQMMPAVSGKYYEVQETSWNMKDTIDKVTSEQFEAQIAVMQETIAYVQTMDAKYNEWKNMLFTCYDYQDNSTPDSAVVATAFAEVVDVHAGYQWSMPATSTTEIDVLIDELDEARVIYASNATANEGFEFDLVEVESPWIGAVLVDSIKTYIYNTKAEAFLGAGNSWGTQASFTATGLEWIVSGESKLYTFDGPMLNGAKHYFDGAYTDAAAKEIRVRQVGDNVFTFIVDGKYLAYDGTSIVANVTELNDACYWQFVTKAERQSKYVIATAETPVDATFEISGANFGRNDGNNSAWVGSPALGGDNANFCAEKWNAGLATVSQELTNMPAGVYRMDVQGFYRMGDVKSATDARVAGTEILHAKFFANGDSINVMSVIDECGKMNEGSQYGSYGLAPNSMAQASHAFSAGLYEHSMYVVLPEGESTINLGVTKTGSVANDWLIFDNFRLTYFGNISMEDVNLAERKAEFVAKYDAFEALYPELGLLMGIQNTYFLPVQEPAYMIKDTIDNVTDIALLDSMITEISNATDSLTVALDIYNGAYAEVFALAGDIFDNSTPINDEVETAMSDALTFNGMMGAYMAQTIQNLEMMVTNLTTAIYDYVPNAVANEGYEFDLTYFVADADETSAGWVNEVSGFNGNFVYKISTEKNTEELKSDGFIEAWQQAAYTGALSYTKDMPNGYYTLSAYTFTSGSTKFFANTDSVVVENTGKFTMSVIDSVLVTDGVLKFGLHVENTNWVGLANIKLVHLGADSSAIELPTLTPIAVEPTTGYEVAMSRINVVFDNLVVPNYEFADSIRVYDAEGNVVAKAGIEDCEPDWETIVYVQLDKAVDVSGTYTISIPAGMFIVEDEYESEAYEATVTLNIVPDGISNIEAGKQTVIVYTITGKAIQTTVDGMKTLEKGIYIVNGKKVYVK